MFYTPMPETYCDVDLVGHHIDLSEAAGGNFNDESNTSVGGIPKKRTTVEAIRRDFISDGSDSDVENGCSAAKSRRVYSQNTCFTVPTENASLRYGKQIEREKRMKDKEEERKKKETEKLQKQKEKEIKKKEVELQKQKRALITVQKKAKRECLKMINTTISPGVLTNSSGAAILNILKENDIKYDIETQMHDNIITVWREIAELNTVGEIVTSEKVEDNVLSLLPIQIFINLVDAFTISKSGSGTHALVQDLETYTKKLKKSLEDRNITIVVQGLEKYFRNQVNKQKRAFKAQVRDSVKNTAVSDGSVTRLDVESALVHLQLETDCSVRFAESDEEVAKLIFNFIKAIAKMPEKRDRLVSGFSFHMESGGTVTVNREGSGLATVWRQQIQQFKNVTAEVANTIIAAYPSPVLLHQAYSRCPNVREAQLLLQDLEVRRGAGVLSTTRRIGKELSRRMYLLMTSKDAAVVLS